jgi:hypothetical protein
MLRLGIAVFAVLSLSIGLAAAQSAPKKGQAAKSCNDVCASYAPGENKRIQTCIQKCETSRAMKKKK